MIPLRRAALPRMAGMLTALLCACAPLRPAPDVGPPASEAERARVLELVRERSGDLKTFKGLARATVEQDGHRSQLREVIVAAIPDRLRLETLAPTAAVTLMRLTASDQGVLFIDASEKTAFASGDPRRLTRKIFGAPLAPRELMYLFCGRVPPEWLGEGPRVGVVGTASYSLSWRQRSAMIDGRTGLLLEVRVADPFRERQRFALTFSPAADRERLPQSFTLELLDQDAHFDFHFQSAQFDMPIRDELFSLDIPPGYSARKP